MIICSTSAIVHAIKQLCLSLSNVIPDITHIRELGSQALLLCTKIDKKPGNKAIMHSSLCSVNPFYAAVKYPENHSKYFKCINLPSDLMELSYTWYCSNCS